MSRTAYKYFLPAALLAAPLLAFSQASPTAQSAKPEKEKVSEREESIILTIDGLTRQQAAVGLKRSRIYQQKLDLEEQVRFVNNSMRELEYKLNRLNVKIRRRSLAWRLTMLRNPLAAPVSKAHDYHRYNWLMKKFALSDNAILIECQMVKKDLFQKTSELNRKNEQLDNFAKEYGKQEQKLEELKIKRQKELERLGALAKTSTLAQKTLKAETSQRLSELKGALPLPVKNAPSYTCDEKVRQKCKSVRINESKDKNAVAVEAGEVVYAGWFRGYGNVVIINHGSGYHSLYAGLTEPQMISG